MQLVNTNPHRISVTTGAGKEKEHHVRIPGLFEVDGELADKFSNIGGVVAADSDEAQAWLDSHPDANPSDGEGIQIARRRRVAGFGETERKEMAIENRRVIGDDAAPGGPASGVSTAAGDRPIDPALQTTEDEVDLLRHGIDISEEPDTGPIGPSGKTLADRTPGSPPGEAEAGMADRRAVGGTLTTDKIPTRSGVRRRAEPAQDPAESETGTEDPGELKGEALEAAVKEHNERADEDESVERIPSDATADEKRAALAAASAEA